jgi:acyl carrier protein
MATNESTDHALRNILGKVIDPKLLPAQLNDEIDLQKDLNIDSVMLVDIILNMEECYSIHVADEDLERLRKVGDLSRLIPESVSRKTAT